MSPADTEYRTWIGKKVQKISGKPFKSQLKINTVTGITSHYRTGNLAFIFKEDPSYVECCKCELAVENATSS